MLCLATLTLAALGPWTYAGFLADPPPPPPPAPSAPAAPILPPEPGPGSTLPRSTAPTAPAGPSPTAGTPPAARETQVAPVLYRMPDAAGQVWEHADPTWLQSFVRGRNQQFVRACVSASCR